MGNLIGKIAPPSRQVVSEMIRAAWARVTPAMITKSFSKSLPVLQSLCPLYRVVPDGEEEDTPAVFGEDLIDKDPLFKTPRAFLPYIDDVTESVGGVSLAHDDDWVEACTSID